MGDVLKAVAGRSSYLVPWLLAAVIFVLVAGLGLLPPASTLHVVPATSADLLTGGIIGAAAAMALGVALAAGAPVIYQALEGYSWPQTLFDWGVIRQTTRRRRLQGQLDALDVRQVLKRGLLWQDLSRYPADDRQIAPTRLGNALRAFETYGLEHFELDSQVLWSELQAVAPEYLQQEVDNSRTSVDFFVALIALGVLYGLLAAVLAVAEHFQAGGWNVGLLTEAVVATAILPQIFYHLAITSTTYWYTTVQAMVNLGRKPLADALGLSIPRQLVEERAMWRAVCAYVNSNYSGERALALDPYRIADASNLPGPSASGPLAESVSQAAAEDPGVEGS